MPTGTLVLPAVGQVLIGVGYGADGTEFTGTRTQPVIWDVRNGSQYGDPDAPATGNLVVPTVGQVLTGVQYNGNPFGSGQQSTGTLALPPINKVVSGYNYGAGGTQYTGNVLLPPESKVLLDYEYGAAGVEFTGSLQAATQRVQPNTVTQSNQGVDILDIFNGFINLIGRTMDFQASADGSFRDVVLWEHPSRVQDVGRQRQVWLKMSTEDIQEAPGPGRWGNKDYVRINMGLVTRGFSDGTQRDIRKAAYHYLYRKRLVDAIQNKHLFYLYQLQPVDPTVWTPPVPQDGEAPLTVEPMTIASLPGPAKTQGEEGTNESTFTITIPCVLLLTLPTATEP